MQCSSTNSEVLKGISIVDTPGILSGEKQRTDRGYDFIGVLEWFAERVDRILLLFDAHKLDISDEFRRSIEALRGHDDKIRIVLNKSDMVSCCVELCLYSHVYTPGGPPGAHEGVRGSHVESGQGEIESSPDIRNIVSTNCNRTVT